MADILASVSIVLGAEVSGFKAAMADARKELKGLVQFSEGLQNVGSNLTKAVSAPIALLATGAVAASAKLDSLKRGLEAISQQELGKQGVTGLVAVQQAAQQTGERIQVLQQIAKQPGLGFETAEQADIRLRAVGISADQSAKSIKAFANAIATTGGGKAEFGTVTTQLSQLGAKGKVLAQDLRPIIEAAPAVAAALQTLYGTVDSETISKSLAKQGQSSKDFIRILTDELAKLPQVTGGLKTIYENDLDALLVASAKVGDGIAKSLNLEAVGEKLGNFITSVGDGFANLSAPAQAAIVTFAALAAATGPVLLGLGTIGAALPAIKAGFAAVQGAAALLTTSLEAGFVALLNPVTIVVAALAAFAVAAYRIETAGQRALASFQEQAAATRKLTTEVSPLLDRYDELRAKTSLTSKEQDEMRAIVEKVTSVMPAAGQGIDDYGKYIGLATEKARDFIKGNQGLEKAIALQSLPAQRQKLLELTQAYDRLLRERDQLNRGAFNGVKVEDLGTQFLVDFQKELGTTATELEKQTRLVAELGTAAGITATQYDALGATFPTLAANLAKLGTAFPIANITSGTDALTSQVRILETLKARLKEVQEQRDKETTVPAIKVDNAEIISLQKRIAELEGTDKASKKAADAIAKLRLELGRLTALDNLLGDTPSEVQVLERRVGSLTTGLKTLVDAGVSTSSRAFRSFATDLVTTSQALDKLRGAGGSLDLKPVEVKSLIPRTIGDTLPQDVARLLGDYAKQAKPFELPVPVKLNMQAIVVMNTSATSIQDSLLSAFKGFDTKGLGEPLVRYGKALQSAGADAAMFGGSIAASFNGLDVAGEKIRAAQNYLSDLRAAGFGPLSSVVKSAIADLRQYSIESQNTQILTQGLKNSFTELGSSIGTALVQGGSVLEAAGKALLKSLADIGAQYGQFIIALGIADVATGFNAPKGFAEIAAGTGLLIASGALGAIAGGIGSSGATGSSSTSPTTSNYGQNSKPLAVQVIAEFKLRGEDLVAIGRQAGYRSEVSG